MAGPGPGRPGGPRRPGGRKPVSGRSSASSTARRLKQRVVTAKGRSVSSKLWLERQLNDPYVAEARDRGFRSRSAFKLAEIDDKARFLNPGAVVVDLGAAPGGWSQVAAERVRAGEGRGRVIALDRNAMDPLPGVSVLKRDFLEPEAVDELRAALAKDKAYSMATRTRKQIDAKTRHLANRAKGLQAEAKHLMSGDNSGSDTAGDTNASPNAKQGGAAENSGRNGG